MAGYSEEIMAEARSVIMPKAKEFGDSDDEDMDDADDDDEEGEEDMSDASSVGRGRKPKVDVKGKQKKLGKTIHKEKISKKPVKFGK